MRKKRATEDEQLYCMNMGARIAVWRTALRMSQERFARAIGVSNHTVYRWESGDGCPNAYRMKRIKELVKEGERKGVAA